MIALRSGGVTDAGSPVVPSATRASMPPSICRSMSLSSASKSILFPLKGVTSAVAAP